jgi:hypothetical protein
VRKPINYKGKTYSTQTELAREVGITHDTLLKRIKAGWPEESWGLPKGSQLRPAGKEVEYMGETFIGLASLGTHLGICPQVLGHRVSRKWPMEYWGKPLGFRPPSGNKPTNEEAKQLGRERDIAHVKKHFPNLTSVVEALKTFLREQGFQSIPTAKELRKLPGGTLLVRGIQINGGLAVVAEAAGFPIEDHRKHQSEGSLKDWDYFKAKLLKWIDENGEPGVMPTSSMLKKGGISQTLLAYAGNTFGGMKVVAERLGLKYTYVTTDKNWDDLEVVKAEVLAWNTKHRRPLNILPTASDLQGTKEDRALHRGIRRHGYYPDVAEILEMEFHGRKRRCGSKEGLYRKRGLAGYCLADMPVEIQQMSISLATALNVDPVTAYAQIIAAIPVSPRVSLAVKEKSVEEQKEGEAYRETLEAMHQQELAKRTPMVPDEAKLWAWENLGIPVSFDNQQVMAAIVRKYEEDGFANLQIQTVLGLLPIELSQLREVEIPQEAA